MRDLFDPPPCRPHSPTSVEAAIKIEPETPTLRARVLDYLRRFGDIGATDEEIQLGLAMDPSTERPRRIELVKAGLVRDSYGTRLTQAGRKAVVWRAC